MGETGTRKPRIGIVVPVFGHSRLIAEALLSIADQDFDGTLVTAVVIDGDPRPETTQTVRSFLDQSERPTYAIFRKNGRLPAARNSGINFLLELDPELDAIYLLDADNRLAPRSIAAFWQCLLDNPQAAWAYPDIGFFGLTWGASGIDFRETAPQYDPFRHLLGNICEAGSMVRGDVFRQGIRFDESYVSGYEDWEFWLQCRAKGLIGARADNSGFQYRRRSDSMLADADRTSHLIKARIFEKHQTLFSPTAIAEQFCRSCAPFLLLDEHGDWLLLAADGRLFDGDGKGLDELLISAQRHFHFAYLPRFALLPVGNRSRRPAPTIERTISLLLSHKGDALHFADTGLNLLTAPDSEGFQIIPIDRLLEGPVRTDLPGGQQGLDELRTRLHIVDGRTKRAIDHRYAGPSGFQIDAFMAERLAGTPPEAAPEAATPKPAIHNKTLLVDPLALLEHHPLKPALAAVLTPFDEASAKAATRFDISATQFFGATFSYNTHKVSFEQDLSEARYQSALIVEDTNLLFYAGELKQLAGRIIFLAGQNLQPAQLLALRSSEHALTAIVCMSGDAWRLRAYGVPSHKIVEPDAIAAFVKGLNN